MAEKIYITFNLLYVINTNGVRQGQSPPGCVGVGNIADRYFGYMNSAYEISRIGEYFPKVISEDTFNGLKLIGLVKIPIENPGTGPTERDLTEDEHALQTLGLIEMRDWIARLRTQIDIGDVVGRVALLQKRASLYENLLVSLAREQLENIPVSEERKTLLKQITDTHVAANVASELPVKSFLEGDIAAIVNTSVYQDAQIASLEALIASTPSMELNHIVAPPEEIEHMVADD